MSGYAYQWAKRQRVGDSSAKTLLKTYAHWAAEDYTTWVTNDELVMDTEFNIQTIRKARVKLQELGYLLETLGRKGETRSIIVYQMVAPAGSTVVQSVNPRTGETIVLSPPSLDEVNSKRVQKPSPSKSGDAKPVQMPSPSKSKAPPNIVGSPSKSHFKPLQISPEAPPNLVTKKGLGLHEKRGREAKAKIAPSLEEKKQEPSPEGTRLHPDWKPSADQVAFAMASQHGWDSTRVVREGHKFRLHWIAVPGDRALKTDWNAMWEKWVLSDDPAKTRSAVATGGALNGDWWETDSGIGQQGGALNVPREKDESTPKYLLRVAKAAGRGPHIDFVLQHAKRSGSSDWYQKVVQYLGEALMPTDFYAS